MLHYIKNGFANLNNNKYFAGIMMILLNIGSKYITIQLSKTQQQFFENTIIRQLFIFSIIWMGIRDIVTSLILTASFTILTQFLFNENSNLCIIPNYMKKLNEAIDRDDDKEITDLEIQKALELLNNVKIREKNKRQKELLKTFL